MNDGKKTAGIPPADDAGHGNGEDVIGAADFQLAELVDMVELNFLLDNFCNSVGIASAIIDLQGNVLIASRWQRICTDFHRVNPVTCARCIESDTELALHLKAAESFSVYNCMNGMTDAASPIIIEGRHLANVFVGQFLLAPPDREFFGRQAEQMGFDREAYFKALDEVPVIPEVKLPAILGFLSGFAKLVASFGLQRLRAERIAAELSRQHKTLEHLVDKRTRQLNLSNERLQKEIIEREQAEAEVRTINAELEQRVEQRTAQLEAANKELEEFSYSMSHDMRTPLRALDGFSMILLEEYGAKLDDEGKRLLKVLRDNAKRMGRLVDDILYFLSMGRRKLELSSVDIARLASELCAEMEASDPVRRLHLEVGAIPAVMCDRSMIREVLQNLLSNAVKFASSAGEAFIEIGCTEGEHENIYSVTDHGVGFDMRYADKLFRVFERVHPTGQYEGSGIGLALVKRIVNRHGGRVWAEGKVNGGATFYFALPVKMTAQG